jgi:hypothetical protein
VSDDDHPLGFKAMCEKCTEPDEPPKQVGPTREPDDGARAQVDKKVHRHPVEIERIPVRPRTVAKHTWEEVSEDA